MYCTGLFLCTLESLVIPDTHRKDRARKEEEQHMALLTCSAPQWSIGSKPNTTQMPQHINLLVHSSSTFVLIVCCR